jgi:hypothetical protein
VGRRAHPDSADWIWEGSHATASAAIDAVFVCTSLLALGGGGAALAGNPQSGPAGGWLPDPGGSGPGTTSTYAAEKAADFAAFVTAMSAQGSSAASESYMLYLNEYHQKTTYYCLVAAIQSLLNTYFGGYVSGGIAAGQNAIASATNTTTGGTYNGPAISYTNQQISRYPRTPSDWLYVSSTTTSATQLWNAYDPWSRLQSNGSCYFGPYYSSSPDRACYVQLSSNTYYQTTTGGFNFQWY